MTFGPTFLPNDCTIIKPCTLRRFQRLWTTSCYYNEDSEATTLPFIKEKTSKEMHKYEGILLGITGHHSKCTTTSSYLSHKAIE